MRSDSAGAKGYQMDTGIKMAAAAALLLASGAGWGGAAAQPIDPVFFKVTPSPTRLVVLPEGSLLLGTRSLAANTGRVDFVDQFGNVASYLTGLPCAPLAAYQPGDANGDDKVDVVDVFYLIGFLFAGGPPPVTRFAPDGMAARGGTLYVATGEIAPAGQAARPERGAVLRFTFSAGLETHGVFFLGSDNFAALRAGETVILTHPSDDTASVSLLVNGFTAISDLTVDESTGRLYIVSRADASVSWIPLD